MSNSFASLKPWITHKNLREQWKKSLSKANFHYSLVICSRQFGKNVSLTSLILRLNSWNSRFAKTWVVSNFWLLFGFWNAVKYSRHYRSEALVSHSTTTRTTYYPILTPSPPSEHTTIADNLHDSYPLSRDQAWTFYWPTHPLFLST